jgi:hypothetical protein
LGVSLLIALAGGVLLAGPPPLKVDHSAPLLLGEPVKPEPGGQSDGPVADNSACFVCHGNFQDESLANVHAKANVGCVKCHGNSLAHRSDEDNITPPDIMIPQAMIDKACHKCHEDHNVPAKKVVAQWQKRCPQKTDASQIVCVDCHGEHRMKVRTVLWDKQTGKLLSRTVDPAAKKKAAK